MPNDRFKDFAIGLSSPAVGVEAIVPSDTEDLDEVTRAINVAGAGTVRVTTPDGTVADVYVAAGIAFPLRAARIWSTGTTATAIRGLY